MSNLPDPSPTSEEDFDPNAPFIASDGLEYACVADKILNRPLSTWRNEHIREARACGVPEAKVRQWIAVYDGNDPRTSFEPLDASRHESSARLIRANFALSRYGYCLLAHAGNRLAHLR